MSIGKPRPVPFAAVGTTNARILMTPGVLYIVATPIGNLDDISIRALDTLRRADVIAAEDTRHSAKLLQHYAINAPMVALHDHNEAEQAEVLVASLRAGRHVALISDAGTPLVSDPGFKLLRAARAAGIKVVPIPGACAAIAALSAAGLPSDRFAFEGFLPPKSAARRAALASLKDEPRTLIFYESPHRVVAALADMAQELGAERAAVIARELTKQFETVTAAALGVLADTLARDHSQQRGEFVILVAGAPSHSAERDAEGARVLRILLAQLPLKQAAELAAKITGTKKNTLYQYGLTLNAGAPEASE